MLDTMCAKHSIPNNCVLLAYWFSTRKLEPTRGH